MGHWGRMRMWLLAMAVAMLGASVLAYTGQVDLSQDTRPAADAAVVVAAGRRRCVRRRHDAQRRLRQQEPGACRRRQRALDRRAGLPGHRVVHDAQGPVRPVARQLARPGGDQPRRASAGRIRAWAPRWRAPPAWRRRPPCSRRWPCWRWRCWPSSSRTSAFAANAVQIGGARRASAPLVVGRLVRQRPPRLRREPRHAGDGLLRHQFAHHRVDELRRRRWPTAWNC